MKPHIFVIAFAVLFGACQSEDNIQLDPEDLIPEEFTQKAFLEMYNGAWCGYSPDGDVRALAIQEEMPEGTFDFIEFHIGAHSSAPDNMDHPELDYFKQFNKGLPTGMVNRISGEAYSRSSWLKHTQDILGETADCGLAIDASQIEGDELTVKVKLAIGPEDLEEFDYYLVCLLYEKEVSGEGAGWDQANWFSKNRGHNGVNDPTHPMYDLPDPIVGYAHPNVALACLNTDPKGDLLLETETRAGRLVEKEYTVDISAFGDDLRIAAYIYSFEDNPQRPGVEHSWMNNVQFVDVGSAQDFD